MMKGRGELGVISGDLNVRSKKEGLDRREVLKRGLKTGVLISASSVLPSCLRAREIGDMTRYAITGSESGTAEGISPVEPVVSKIRSVLADVTDRTCVDDQGRVDEGRVRIMFDEALKAYTGKPSSEEAWIAVIPGLKDTDVIGIKINCINPRLPTHPSVVRAVADSLIRYGVKPNNIIVWDRAEKSRIPAIGNMVKSGYVLNDGGSGIRYLGTARKGLGYDSQVCAEVPSIDEKISVSRICSTLCDHLINIPQLRSHQVAGVSLCMKNYYGAVGLGDRYKLGLVSKVHKNSCNPQIPEIYNNPVFRDRTRLHVADALFGIFEGGPMGSPQWISRRLFLSQDPVAMDYHGLLIIERKRREKGVSSILAKAKYIQTAAEMGLGTNHPDQIERREISMG